MSERTNGGNKSCCACYERRTLSAIGWQPSTPD